MPYSTNQDLPDSVRNHLPDSVRNHLPAHAQEIYRAAFNSAWDEYKDADKRRGDDSREEVAHKVAWSAVKDKYQKGEDGDWKRSNES